MVEFLGREDLSPEEIIRVKGMGPRKVLDNSGIYPVLDEKWGPRYLTGFEEIETEYKSGILLI